MGWTYRFHELGSGILAARAARDGRLAVSRTLFESDLPLLYRDALDHELDHGTDGPVAVYRVVAGVLPEPADEGIAPDGSWALRAATGSVSLGADRLLTVADGNGRALWQALLPDSGELEPGFFQQVDQLRAGRPA